MKIGTIWLGYENSLDLLLREDRRAVDLSNVIRVRLVLESSVLESASRGGDVMLWCEPGYRKGEVRLFLGGQNLSLGSHSASLVVDEVVWGQFEFDVRRLPG
ncbi:MAG: hypothetical protein ABFD97_14445 [Syntrophobacter sp.]